MENSLSTEQSIAIDSFNKGKNIFITGPGGSGKTFLIKQMVNISKQKDKNIQVCALTGCAALLLQCKAKTLHSWAGIGLAKDEIDIIIERVKRNKTKRNRWKEVDILVIDEISMLSKNLFELLNEIAQRVRRNNLPFGGIQLVLSGDFYQLPPVFKNKNEASGFCFESNIWSSCVDQSIVLKKIFRQNDERYVKCLNQIRQGKISRKSLEALKNRLNVPFDDQLIKPTKLLPTRKKVDTINSSEFNKLDNETRIFEIVREKEEIKTFEAVIKQNAYSAENVKNEYIYLENNIMAEKVLELKVNTQVMCIANLNENIVNGSQGVIESFVGDFPLVVFKNGIRQIITRHTWMSENIPGLCVKQIPLIHSWAITIHKAQGVTLDTAIIDVGKNIFECGQTYVALSRVKSLDGLYLSNFDVTKIKVSKKVSNFYRNLS